MNLLGKASEPSFWETVRTDEYYSSYRESLLDVWHKLCEDKEIPSLLYSEYKLFWSTGDRKTYEKSYFARRHIMNASAILALIYPDENKYLKKLCDIVFEICNEYTWCLPSHVDSCDSGVEVSNIVDLFAAETGFSLAEIYVLLGERLDSLVRERITSEVNRRVITSTLDQNGRWWWESKTNNWSAVCAGSLGCTAMLLCPEKFEEMKPRLNSAIENYISGFTSDGMCPEGCSYWDYGFGFFVIYADMLERFTDGAESYFEREKIKAMSTFLQKVYLEGNVVANFSDAHQTHTTHIGIIHYLKSRYPNDVKLPSAKNCGFGRPDRFSYLVATASWADKNYSGLDEIASEKSCVYDRECQWYVNKSSKFALAAKGGCNAESHNHNDIGHFIFVKCGKQIFADLGAGLYDKKYFSDKRYEIFEPSSFSHSVPIIDNDGQLPGKEYAACVIEATDKKFSLDIAAAYGNAKVKSIVRCFDILDDGISITDRFCASDGVNIVERFVTWQKPQIISDGLIEVDGTTLAYSNDVANCTVTKKTTDLHECYLIDLVLKEGSGIFTCTIK